MLVRKHFVVITILFWKIIAGVLFVDVKWNVQFIRDTRDYLYFLLLLRNFLGDKFVQRYTLSSFTISGNARHPKYLPTKKVANTELCGPECNLADKIESQYPVKLSRFATRTDQDFYLEGNRVRQNDNFL